MKEEQTNLYYREGSSDKVYGAELKKEQDGWVVNFAYGRRGAGMSTGSKTPAPVSYEQAKAAYDKLVKEKKAKGYTEDPSGRVFQGAIGSDHEDTGVRPQLLNPIEESELEKYLKDDDWLAQEKFDGRRRLLFCQGPQSYGANRKGLKVDITDEVLEVLQEWPEGTILDGEDLGDRVVIFDMLNSKADYFNRFLMLMTMWVPSKVLELAETAHSEESKRQVYAELKANKAEGIVFKRLDAPYTAGRPNSGGPQVKFKFVETASCVVTGVHKSKRSVSLGVFVDDGITQKLVEVGNVTIYPNQQIPAVRDIVEIKYLYFFPGGSLYQPVYIGKRDDLDLPDCQLSKLKLKQTTETDE
jgi:bifunctional non-homologous end joining protein LigD